MGAPVYMLLVCIDSVFINGLAQDCSNSIVNALE